MNSVLFLKAQHLHQTVSTYSPSVSALRAGLICSFDAVQLTLIPLSWILVSIGSARL